FLQARNARVLGAALVDGVGVAARAARGVDVHPVALERADQRLLAFGQLVLVLVDVRGVDREQRLVVLERVDARVAGLPSRRRPRDPAGPGRNRAVLVPGLFGAHR